MYKYILTAILILTFAACTKQPVEYSTKTYKNIDKNAVLNAAKRVLRLSDSDFRVYSKRNSVEGSKTNIIYKGFSPDISVSKIILETRHEDAITRAKLVITKNKNYDDKKAVFVSQSEYDFFWNRMDYILGLNKVWKSCYAHLLSNESILCDFIYNENNNAKVTNIIKDTSIFVQEEIKQYDDSVITQIDLDILDNIQLPFEKKEINMKTKEVIPIDIKNEVKVKEEVKENNDVDITQIQ